MERATLDRLEARYRRGGYDFLREPDPALLPEPLRPFRLDAVAIGPSGNVAIEVIPSGRRDAATTARRLKTVVAALPGWTLDLVVFQAREVTTPRLVSRSAVRSTLGEAAALKETHPSATLLLAWSALEGAVRLRDEAGRQAMASTLLASTLVSEGYASQEEGQRLRLIGHVRNAIAHGEVDRQPGEGDLDFLLGVTERMLVQEAA